MVFTTADGGLYLYDTRRVVVEAVFADQEISGGFHAAAATIDPIWGRFVVWQDIKRRSIFVLDRWTRLIDTVPFVSIAWDAESVTPGYYGYDPFNVVLLVTFPDGSFRLMNYNILTELLINLTWFNDIGRSKH
ncbi:hypothetical protein D3C72_1109960 [compost metagenome]